MNELKNCHMPYLFEDYIFYCKKIDGKWKLHYNYEGNEYCLTPEKYKDYTFCNPVAMRKDSSIYLSYVFGCPEQGIPYKLSRINIDKINVPHITTTCTTGFFLDNGICFGLKDGRFMMITQKSKVRRYQILGIKQLCRIIPYESNLLVTVINNDSSEHSYIVDITDLSSKEILVNNTSIYKCSIQNDTIAYAVKLSQEFEDREIRFSNNYDLVNSELRIEVIG